ncbi:MAG: phytanoyl-CoA dioxygenase family protein [Planctomycetota bacterium]|nr:phytanoyl-CoA dioxygenase family protein [Planctomycetota bacterium]
MHDDSGTQEAKPAPPGFTREQWERFDREGYLVIEDAIEPEAVRRYREALARIASRNPKYRREAFFGPQNAVTLDAELEELIDHPRHTGFAYDLYGELTKLHLSQLLMRPRNSSHNIWHPDGARALPFQVFSPRLPLQFKVGYWLTDLPRARMGNLTVLPRSHRMQYMNGYDTHEPVEGEHVLCLKAGAMTLLHCSTWHRVEPNESETIRENLFLSYCPAWINPEDRYTNDPAWLAKLTRERRILMRSYGHPYTNTKPPAEDFPLFLDRASGADRDPGVYREHVELHRRKRVTQVERWLAEEAKQSL